MIFSKPQILMHKKFQAAFIASLSALFGIFGPALAEATTFWIALGMITPAEWAIILGPVLVAIGAQGWADSGKEAAKINNGNGRQTTWEGPDKVLEKKE